MQFTLINSLAIGTGATTAGFIAAIAVLACIFGAELAGICILVGKLMRAKRARKEQERKEGSNRQTYDHRAMGIWVLLGAIPQTYYITLTSLAALTALAAVVFVVLLVIFRLCGYDFEVPGRVKRQSSKEEPFAAPERLQEEPTYAPLDDEGQAQEEYTPYEELAERYDEENDPLSVYDETEFEKSEEVEADELVDESAGELTAVEEAPAASTTVVRTVTEGPVFADGTQPYKVVEKVVTETVKEVYKETPTASVEPAQKNGNDAVMEKLADFLEYELQKRKEEDQAAPAPAAPGDVATFAAADADEDEDDDEELDDEAEDAAADPDDDSDDEENDIDDDRFTGNERIIGFDEETGCYIVAHYRKSFEAKLIQSRANIKRYYSEIKNALLSYGDTKSRISWATDSFTNGRTPIAKINVKTRVLELYLALEPASLEDSIYKGTDVGQKKKYADTPFRYKIRSPRKLKWALELVTRTCEEHGLSPIDIEAVNYEEQYPFDTTDNLVARKLIKEYIRQEKPATSFELAPDHVPTVPDEDESVIPANANFSWEFDNEVLEEKAEEAEAEVIEEAVEEPTPEPEPEPEPAPAAEPVPTVTRETVKVTEMRYTERYYAGGAPTYERVVTTEETVPALSEPMDAAFEEPAAEAEDETDGTAEMTYTEDVSTDPFAAYHALEAEEAEEILGTEDIPVFAEAEEAPAEEEQPEALPFRPSYYAARNDYGEAPVAQEAEPVFEEPEETVFEEEDMTEVEAEEAYTVESEPTEEEPIEEDEPTSRVQSNPAVAVIDLCAIEAEFPMGAVISLETLKAKELILPAAETLKIYASGPISKSFTVEANHFTLDAIQAITAADGDSVMVR